MLSTSYNYMNFAKVSDLGDLFKSNLPEMTKVKGLLDNSKMLFDLPTSRVDLMVSEGDRVYKIMLLTPDVNKYPFGWIIYLPLQKRLDIYSADSPSMPIIQWKGKKVAFKNYSTILDRAGLDKIFDKLVNII